jgi:hypothetical protein
VGRPPPGVFRTAPYPPSGYRAASAASVSRPIAGPTASPTIPRAAAESSRGVARQSATGDSPSRPIPNAMTASQGITPQGGTTREGARKAFDE